MRVDNAKLAALIAREQAGIKGWDGEPLSKLILDLMLDLRDAREVIADALKKINEVDRLLEIVRANRVRI